MLEIGVTARAQREVIPCNHDAIMMHSGCTQDALGMHSGCTQDALRMHSGCTQDALSISIGVPKRPAQIVCLGRVRPRAVENT